MKLSIDSAVGLLAPHLCLSCGVEGSVLCNNCIEAFFDTVPSQCAGCRALSEDFTVCTSCRKWLPLKHIYFTSIYSGVAEQLIHELKFECRRQTVEPVARVMSALISDQNRDVLLCPIPTAPARIRERGFDHCKLLCKEISRLTGLHQKLLLHRTSNKRQVGSSRQARFAQMEEEFIVLDSTCVKNKHILIIDDVMTSGASLSAAAKQLKNAGAKEVNALIFARK